MKPTWQDQPTIDGYYWFIDNKMGNREPEFVMVYDFKLGEGLRAVAYMATGTTDYLVDIEGKWIGPITAPEEK